jgi:hypothetical protein
MIPPRFGPEPVTVLALHDPRAAFLYRERGAAMRWALSSARSWNSIREEEAATEVAVDEIFDALVKVSKGEIV